MEIEDESSKEKRTVKMKIQSDSLPAYFKRCKLQGHSEVDCWVLHPELRKEIEFPGEIESFEQQKQSADGRKPVITLEENAKVTEQKSNNNKNATSKYDDNIEESTRNWVERAFTSPKKANISSSSGKEGDKITPVYNNEKISAIENETSAKSRDTMEEDEKLENEVGEIVIKKSNECTDIVLYTQPIALAIINDHNDISESQQEKIESDVIQKDFKHIENSGNKGKDTEFLLEATLHQSPTQTLHEIVTHQVDDGQKTNIAENSMTVIITEDVLEE
ncbi:hypothetical protein CQW23_18186 [Capsicum baccatum]|uniref:DUF4283 domain-containing protein n=1 Tax=Capsicum baccatum TaxID=33114 RepID=A0A2G2WG01_CAPBA|nr:hypothetical protein CQW23_18186 [Capsicum baccatum]